MPRADVVLARDGKPQLSGRTDESGRLRLAISEPPRGTITVSAPGRGSKEVALAADVPASLAVELLEAGTVVASITDEHGGASRARFNSSAATRRKAPTSGPIAASMPSRTCTTAKTAGFASELPPGSYDVIVSYGPEYDAVFARLDVEGARSRFWRQN